MSDQSLILALDQGTSSSRAILFDRAGNVHGLAQRPIASSYPHPGWVEQDAGEILDTTLAVGRTVLAETGIAPARVAAVAIANQRETTVIWDRRTGRPVAPAIVWQSRQSQPLVDAIIARGMASEYERITGLVPDAYFSATKIAWLLERLPDLRPLAERGDVLFGTVETWLLWNLANGAIHATDAANASRTMLLDLHSGAWSEPLLEDLRIPPAMLPRVIANSGPLAEIDARHFGRALPLTGMAGDQQAALFGQACFAPGQAK
ncbi:MAG: glycerol kinase, partial [Thermomicrobiales bacterium]|nr:glycerol kinase [Thermomicrobiales bacterium]